MAAIITLIYLIRKGAYQEVVDKLLEQRRLSK